MLGLHKEGFEIIGMTTLILGILNLAAYQYFPQWVLILTIIISIILYILVLQFFRNPKRVIQKKGDHLVYAPADGKIVVIEEAEEVEYFKEKKLQISIFMSPLNVHVNRNPISGKVNYYQYHEGKYLVAWHPKSSTENERTTVVLDNGKNEILIRQIAGALARRIVNYLGVGQTVHQGEEMGFIKFGSRVDLFLPLGTKVNVKIDEVVRGNQTLIAELPQ